MLSYMQKLKIFEYAARLLPTHERHISLMPHKHKTYPSSEPHHLKLNKQKSHGALNFSSLLLHSSPLSSFLHQSDGKKTSPLRTPRAFTCEKTFLLQMRAFPATNLDVCELQFLSFFLLVVFSFLPRVVI